MMNSMSNSKQMTMTLSYDAPSQLLTRKTLEFRFGIDCGMFGSILEGIVLAYHIA